MAAAMAAGAQVLDLRVLAEDEAGLKYEWRFEALADTPLSEVASKWAAVHQCSAEAVGFEDEVGLELPLHGTPCTLGWLGREVVRITAFPQDEDAREQVAEDPAPTRPQEAVGASAESTPPQDDSTASLNAKESSTQEEDEDEDEEAGTPAAGSQTPQTEAGVQEAAPQEMDSDAKEEQMSADAGADSEVLPESHSKPLPSPARAKPAAAAPPVRKDAKSKAKAQAQKQKPTSKAKSAPKKGQEKAKGKAVQQASTPSGSERIKFAPNPKREGSLAHARYEVYKKAKTVDEALKKGAKSGDITFDFKHGFLMRV